MKGLGISVGVLEAPLKLLCDVLVEGNQEDTTLLGISDSLEDGSGLAAARSCANN